MKTLALSIVIPAYNEASTIPLLLDRICQVELIQDMSKEIIVVNDGSTDMTKLILQEYMSANPEMNIRYIEHVRNQGKGAAVQTGIAAASGDYLIIQDADLEYHPEDYNKLLKPVFVGGANVVYGSRFKDGNPHRVLFFMHRIGNRFLTLVSNIFTNLGLTDVHTCYKLFETPLIKSIPLQEKDFAFCPEVTAKIARIPNLRIYEVGISYYGRTYQEGKKIRWRDGFRAIYCMMKYNLFYRNRISPVQPFKVHSETRKVPVGKTL